MVDIRDEDLGLRPRRVTTVEIPCAIAPWAPAVVPSLHGKCDARRRRPRRIDSGFSGRRPRGGATNRLWNTELREIVVEREGKDPLYLITNDHTRTASEIAALYKLRWQIELFFKWIKQNLKIKSFLGRSENAVRIQIYVALIAFILLRLFKESHARGHKASHKVMLARLKVSLLERFDLTERAKPPPKPPHKRPPNPQLQLQFMHQNVPI